MYEGDAPLAERRAAALALDRDLLRDLLGAEELRELVDAGVLADLELELQRLVDGRRARDVDEVHDLLRLLGPLSSEELAARAVEPDRVPGWVDQLVAERRAFLAGVAGEPRVAAAEDAGRLRDALGRGRARRPPAGLHRLGADAAPRPRGPVRPYPWPLPAGPPRRPVRRRPGGRAGGARPAQADGRVVRGEFRPDGVEREWCDDDVLRQLRRRSLAVLRREVEPVDAGTLARFLPRWHGVGSERRGPDALVEVVAQLQAAPLVASTLDRDVLGARLVGYEPGDLDALCTAGEVVWVGAGSIGATDGRVRLAFRDQAGLLLPDGEGFEAPDPLHEALLAHLEARGASFWADLTRAAQAAEQPYDDATVLRALWDLVWAGLVTNDSLAPLRSFVGGSGRAASRTARSAPRGRPRPGRLARLGPPAAPGAGRSSRPCSSRARPPPRPRTRVPCSCSSGTASSPGRRRSARAPRAGSPACTRCSRPSRSVARCGAGTSWPASAPPSSPWPGRSTACGRSATRPPRARPTCPSSSRPPTRPSRSARRCRGPRPRAVRPAPRARWWCSPVAWPSPTSSAGAHRLLRFPAGVEDDRWATALGAMVDRGRFRSLELRTVDGVSVHEADAAVRAALEQAGFRPAYKGWTRRPPRG